MIKLDSQYVKQELEYVGIFINDIYDLVNTKKKYPKAIPVLVKLLREVSDAAVKEGIIRALAVKEAKGVAGKALFKEYHTLKNSSKHLAWAIGNTIAVIITNDDEKDVLEIVQNPYNGMSRQMFALALGKIKSDSVEQVLINLLDDEEIVPHVLDALAMHKSRKAIDRIEALINHHNLLIRKEAHKALKKIK